MRNNWLSLIVVSALIVLCAVPASAIPYVAGNDNVVQLGFILDSSGSIGSADWNVIRTGLSNAIGTLIPVGGPYIYEISVVTFSTSASANISNFLVTDAATRTALAGQIATLPYIGDLTNYTAAFTTMRSTLAGSPQIDDVLKKFVNFSTDGEPNVDTTNTAAALNSLKAYVDNLSVEGIGGFIDTAYLQGTVCYPGPCDLTSPYNFPTQGFYIGIASVNDYQTAITEKLLTVTGGGEVPEPTTYAMLGCGLLALGLMRRMHKH